MITNLQKDKKSTIKVFLNIVYFTQSVMLIIFFFYVLNGWMLEYLGKWWEMILCYNIYIELCMIWLISGIL